MNTPSIAALEAILFAAPRPFTLKELAVHLDCTVPEAHKLLQELEQRLAADPNRGLMVDRVAHGYRLATKPELGEYVARVARSSVRARCRRPPSRRWPSSPTAAP